MPKGWHRLAAGPGLALSFVALATVAGVMAPAGVRAAEPAESFDDPKLARELPAAPPVVAPVPVPAPIVGAAPAKVPPTAPPKVTVAPPPKPTEPLAKPSESVVAPTPPVPPIAVAPAPLPAPVSAVAPAPGAVVVPVGPLSPPPVVAEAPAPAAAAPAEAALPPAPVPAPVPAAPPPEAVAAPVPTDIPSSPASAAGTADLTVKAHPPEPPAPAAPSGPWPYHPRLKLGYRWFSFSRMPATGSTAATASESFQSLSLDVYPMSSYLRVGFSSQFGWESGQFQRTGDYFLAESATTGFQLPGRFTPFIEGLAGAGYMRRLQGTSTSPTAYWQLGVDGGVEIYLAKRAYVSVALGYLHPGNLFLQQKNLSGINADTWSLKVGLGI